MKKLYVSMCFYSALGSPRVFFGETMSLFTTDVFDLLWMDNFDNLHDLAMNDMDFDAIFPGKTWINGCPSQSDN